MLAAALGCTDIAIVRRLALLEMTGALWREHPAAEQGHAGLPRRRIHVVGRPRERRGTWRSPETRQLPVFVDELAADGWPQDATTAAVVAILAYSGASTRAELDRRTGRSVDAAVDDLLQRGVAVIEGDRVRGLDLDP